MDLKNLGNSFANLAGEAGKRAMDISEKAAKTISKSAENIDIQKVGEIASNASKEVQKMAVGVSDKAKEGVVKSAETVNKVMDVNGDGQVGIEDIIIMGLRIPGICISREEFLRSEFMKDYPQEIIEDAIAFNPAHAGISSKK